MPAKKLTVKHYAIDPRELKLLEKNARRMSARQFNQLVVNIKADGALTSVPLVHRQGDDLVVLSGNHRTKASIAAGLAEITIMEVFGNDLTPERLIALQLSHNAITGDDDQNILKELYDSLDVMSKLYSGLTDDSFGMIEALDLSKLAIGTPTYHTVNLMFLPEDHETFKEAMESLGKGAAKTKRYISRLADFEKFEKALVAVQDHLNIHNQAMSILAMAELALERLEQMEITDGEDANGDNAETSEG
jgi:ParB-like chromosome segregation protein Spo0J